MKAEIKPQDLRLGNLLIRPTINPDNATETINIVMPVTHVDIRDAVLYGKNWNAEPIELSEEWLDRAGFKKLEGGNIVNCSLPYWAKDALLLFFNESPPYNTYLVGYGFNIGDQYYAATHRWINSVHELQNVYKEYRNTELTLKRNYPNSMTEEEAIRKCYELKNLYVTEAPKPKPNASGLIDELIRVIVICDFVRTQEIDGKEQLVFQPETIAKAAASVCRKHIEKAYQAGEEHKMVEDEKGVHLRTFDQWLKENGITE